MQSANHPFLDQISHYYSEKLAEYGQTPRGVDWNGADGQNLRFKEICRIFSDTKCPFSVNDVGCGYGALLDYLRERHQISSYVGTDISPTMIATARHRYGTQEEARFILAADPDRVADFTVASGIFNVRLEQHEDAWKEYIRETLDVFDRTSRNGFAFNCLTSYSDADRKRDDLYYGDPCLWFDYCKRRYSQSVALFHDYGLWEFTILVRK